MFHPTLTNHERYTAAYNNGAYRAITTVLDAHMPADDAQIAVIALQDACYERTEHGNRRLGLHEIELKRLMLYHLPPFVWVACVNAVNTYLARFNA